MCASQLFHADDGSKTMESTALVKQSVNKVTRLSHDGFATRLRWRASAWGFSDRCHGFFASQIAGLALDEPHRPMVAGSDGYFRITPNVSARMTAK